MCILLVENWLNYAIIKKMRKNKKITILYVLKILKECSSEKKPISQSLITRTINLAGINCDRKTIARDIDTLAQFGYQIIKVKGIGCYMEK